MKYWYVALAILLCLSIVFWAGWYKASADARIQSRIVSTQNEMIENKDKFEKEQQRLREKKFSDCALIKGYPQDLFGICW